LSCDGGSACKSNNGRVATSHLSFLCFFAAHAAMLVCNVVITTFSLHDWSLVTTNCPCESIIAHCFFFLPLCGSAGLAVASKLQTFRIVAAYASGVCSSSSYLVQIQWQDHVGTRCDRHSRVYANQHRRCLDVEGPPLSCHAGRELQVVARLPLLFSRYRYSFKAAQALRIRTLVKRKTRYKHQ